MTRTELGRLLRRLTIPLGSLVLVVALLLTVTGELRGRLAQTDARIDQLKRDTASAVRKIRRIKANLDFVREHGEIYDRTRDAGFLAPQDRLAAGKRLEQLAVETDLNNVEYTFDAARRAALGNQEADAAALVATPLEIQVQATFDSDIFAFVDKLRDGLPGYLLLVDGELRRAADADLAAEGELTPDQERPDVISAGLSLAWVRLAFPSAESGADG